MLLDPICGTTITEIDMIEELVLHDRVIYEDVQFDCSMGPQRPE